jgi:hypothetical protein
MKFTSELGTIVDKNERKKTILSICSSLISLQNCNLEKETKETILIPSMPFSNIIENYSSR